MAQKAMTGATQTNGIVKTVIFHVATGFVVTVAVLTEVALPADTSAMLRIALVFTALAFLVAGATVYLYSAVHDSVGCLLLNIVAFVLVTSTMLAEMSGDPTIIFVTRLSASLVATLLVRAFFNVAPGARTRRTVVMLFDAGAVVTVLFVFTATALRMDDALVRAICDGAFATSLVAAMCVLIGLTLRTRDVVARTEFIIILIVAVAQAALMTLLGTPDPAAPLAWLWVLSSVLLPLAVVAPTFRNKLGELRLQRSLVYALLTAIVSGAYATALVTLALTMHLTGLTAAVGIGAVSITFIPLVRAVHRAVDRWFYQDEYDYRAVLNRFYIASREFRHADDLAKRLCDEVMSALNLSWCAVYIGSGSDKTLLHTTDPLAAELASHEGEGEHESIEVRRFTLGAPGHDVGQLVIGLRNHRARLRHVDSDLLRTIAYQAGIVLENSQLVASLAERIRSLEEAQSTTRILHRRLSESEERTRARLSRDLHDGALQSLFHLVRVAEDLSATVDRTSTAATAATAAQIVDLADLGRDIAFELRQVCEDLRPPLLGQLSLPLALEALANRYRTVFGFDISVHVIGDADVSVPDEHQVTALYRVTSEALANARRHAQATLVTVELEFSADSIHLSIHDDGSGFSVEPPDLLGLTEGGHLGVAGMFERIDILDGRIEIRKNTKGGTTVDITLPNMNGDSTPRERAGIPALVPSSSTPLTERSE